MVYLSYSIWSCSGKVGAGTGYSLNSCSGFGYPSSYNCLSNSIDSFVDYSRPEVNALEVATANAVKYAPIFFDAKPNLGFNYESAMVEAGYRNNYGIGYNNISNIGMQQIDSFSPDLFLREGRAVSQFIGSAEEIKSYIIETFEKTTGKKFPNDISIKVVDSEELKDLHKEFGGKDSPGLQGFSINKKGFGNSLIIVKENDLDRLMITIGHEMGHVMNFPLPNKLDEEAKAFAFEMEWIKTLFNYNIANMKSSINPHPEPATNGLHDVAFNFVKKQILFGKKPFEIIDELMKNKISVADKSVCL